MEIRVVEFDDNRERLRVFIVHFGERTKLDVGGEIDMATAGRLAERLAMIVDVGGGDVEIDLSQVTFCDSSGLKVLLTAERQLRRGGRRMSLTAASDQVTRLLAITGTQQLFEPLGIGDTAQQADAGRRVLDPLPPA